MALVSLATFTFYVTDALTGLPIQDASCVIYQGFNQTGDAVASRTDPSGMAIVETVWFVPRSYSVFKSGYITAKGNDPPSILNVQLTPTTTMFSLLIFAGEGGSVTPSGNFTVLANETVKVTATPNAGFIFDAWVVNAVVQDNTNPKTFIIDRDAYTIAARFKVAETPPPPPNDLVWPVTRRIHVFDSKVLDGGAGLGVSKSANVTNVDMETLVGGKLEYTINYLSGTLPGIGAIVEWNGELVDSVNFTAFDVGKSVSRSLDLTGKIGTTNTLRVGFSQGPLGFNRVLFDVWLTLGFRSEPAIDPTTPMPPPDLNTLLIIGAIGIVGLILLSGRGPTVAIIQPKKS